MTEPGSHRARPVGPDRDRVPGLSGERRTPLTARVPPLIRQSAQPGGPAPALQPAQRLRFDPGFPFARIAADDRDQTMLATGPAGPEPRKAPLQRPRLAGTFEAMPLALLDGSVPLPKHRAIRALPVQTVAPAASEEGSGGHLSLTARQGRTPRSRRGSHSSGQNRMVLPLRAGDSRVPGATRGSPRQFEHPVKRGHGTVAGKDSDDVAPGTFNSILKQAKLKGH